MIRRPPRSTQGVSSAASDVYKRQGVVMKKAQYFITCNELPTRTVNELTPTGVRRLLVPKPKQKVDERQLILNFTDNE